MLEYVLCIARMATRAALYAAMCWLLRDRMLTECAMVAIAMHSHVLLRLSRMLWLCYPIDIIGLFGLSRTQ